MNTHYTDKEKHSYIKRESNKYYENTYEEKEVNFSKSFPYIFTKIFLEDLDDGDIDSILSNLGSNDFGIDAYYCDIKEKIFYFFQFKTTQTCEHSNYKREALEDFNGLPNRLKKISIHSNSKVQDIIEEYNEEDKKDYKTKLIFAYTSDKYNQDEVTEYKDIEFYDLSQTFELFKAYESKEDKKDTFPEKCIIEFHTQENNSAEFSLSYNPIDSKPTVIGVINGKFIMDLMKEHYYRLFDRNVRYFLGKNKINEKIMKTAEKEPEEFFYYNNGITITCEKFHPTVNKLELIKPQVINGAQTLNSIYEVYKKKPDHSNLKSLLLLVTVITSIEGDKTSFSKDLTNYRNSNNPIKLSDYKGNAEEQEELQKLFYKENYFYEIKRGEINRYIKNRQVNDQIEHNTIKPYQFNTLFKKQNIKIETLGKLWCSYKAQDPYTAKSLPTSIFSDDNNYNKVFPKVNDITKNTIKEMIFVIKVDKALQKLEKLTNDILVSNELSEEDELLIKHAFDKKYTEFKENNNEEYKKYFLDYIDYLNNSKLYIIAMIGKIVLDKKYNIENYYNSPESIISLHKWIYQILKLIDKSYTDAKSNQRFANYTKKPLMWKNLQNKYQDADNDVKEKFILK